MIRLLTGVGSILIVLSWFMPVASSSEPRLVLRGWQVLLLGASSLRSAFSAALDFSLSTSLVGQVLMLLAFGFSVLTGRVPPLGARWLVAAALAIAVLASVALSHGFRWQIGYYMWVTGCLVGLIGLFVVETR